jgi:hypothetical protein
VGVLVSLYALTRVLSLPASRFADRHGRGRWRSA